MKAPNNRNGSDGSDKKSEQVGEKYRAGFDLLRVVAAALIFSQHAFTVTNLDHYNHVFGFRIGRLGTAILFAMSGYLSASTSRSPGAWLWGRLTRLYPAFWVVLAVGFAATAVTGRKEFDFVQVACQFAGVGFFTHPWQLVLLTTWFVSVILLMTVLIYLARRFGHGIVFGPAVLGIVAGAHGANPYVAEYYGFAMAFLIGYGLAAPAGAGRWLLPLIAVGAVAMLGLPGFRYGLCAAGLLAVAVRDPWPVWGAAQKFPPIAYEWFLAHGLCIQFVYQLTSDPWVVFAAAASLSVLAAVVVRGVVESARRHLPAVARPSNESRPAPAAEALIETREHDAIPLLDDSTFEMRAGS